MRIKHGIQASLGLGTLVLGLGVASAQQNPEVSLQYTPGFDPEQFAGSADPDQIGLIDGARTQTMGSLSAGIVFHFAGPPLDICVRDAASPDPACQIQGDILNSRLRADLGLLYGFGRFDVRLNLPFVLHQSTDFSPGMNEEALGSNGVGDPKVAVRFQIARPGPMDIAADLGVSIPTGGENFIGDHGVVVDPRLLFDVRKGRIGFGVNLGYRFRQESAKVANLYVDDEITWSVAGQYWIKPHKFALGAAAYGKIGFMSAPEDPMALPGIVEDLGSEEYPAEVLGSLRYFVTDKIALDVGGGTALSQGYGATPYRVLAGMRWINQKTEQKPLVSDRDHDGIDDSDDKCPDEPEDIDGFEDLDGCPEADNDGDGINDGDDSCPMVAEDMDGFEDTDGCPDEDNDKDGIKDADDGCPTEAEDMDGYKDEDGCPETDADGDGIKDEDDKCPLEAEIFNGSEDEDGCPDDGRALAFDDGTAVVITDKIYFDLNRARIKTRSQPVLNAVAAILKAKSDLKVRVEGHTDDRGEPDWNRTLSQLRSERVREYLIKKGISPDRLEAKGYGYDRPLVEGTSEAARDQNRRVEFVIIGRDGSETHSGEDIKVDPGTVPEANGLEPNAPDAPEEPPTPDE
jgi:outer membrane protein OmpA-like peptidoglycan-associated protein